MTTFSCPQEHTYKEQPPVGIIEGRLYMICLKCSNKKIIRGYVMNKWKIKRDDIFGKGM